MVETATRLSPSSRLIHRALTALEACTCAGQPKRVCVLRGFDGRSRQRAHQIRSRLTRDGVTAFTAAVPVVALDPRRFRDQHVCVHVDVTEGEGESGRIAALTRTSLVTLAPSATDPNASESAMPVLRAGFGPTLNQPARRPFPSAAGRVPDVALDTFLITPNQPETGELTVRVGEMGGRDLQPGTSISLRCLPETILVEAITPRGETVTWLTGQLQVRQQSGIHRIYRDGLLVTDLAETLIVQHDSNGLRRQHA